MSIIPALLAGIFFKRSQLKLFNVFAFLPAVIDLLLSYTSFRGMENWIIIDVYFILELILVSIFIPQNLLNKHLKPYLNVISPFVVLGCTVLMVFNKSITMTYIQNLYLLILSCIFLMDFVKNYEKGPYFRSARFRIAITFLFSFFGASLLLGLSSPLLNRTADEEFVNWYYLLNFGLNFISYILYSLSILAKHE